MRNLYRQRGTNDCAIAAMATFFQAEYSTVMETFLRVNRRTSIRGGSYPEEIWATCKELGSGRLWWGKSGLRVCDWPLDRNGIVVIGGCIYRGRHDPDFHCLSIKDGEVGDPLDTDFAPPHLCLCREYVIQWSICYRP